MIKMKHDEECELLPGGAYHGRTIGNPPMQIPCHCLAREHAQRNAMCLHLYLHLYTEDLDGTYYCIKCNQWIDENEDTEVWPVGYIVTSD